jgi:hypothetical protein
MTKDKSSLTGYSPPICITLEFDGMRFDVAAVGTDHLVLRSPRECAPAIATLIVKVDGQEVIRRVQLPKGINRDLKRQPMVVLETVTLAKAS